MNNQFINIKDDGIGVDPTVVTKIESLDDEPVRPTRNTKLPKSKTPLKRSEIIKRILFTVVVIALMALVSYGVYYYLSLGRKTKNVVKLENHEFFMGEALPTNVLEYGDFSKVDIAKCNLNTDNVDINKTGKYKYAVKCADVEYNGVITIIEKVLLNLSTKLVYKNITESIKVEDFIDTEEAEYKFELVDADKKYDLGLHSVAIKATNTDGKSAIIYGAVYFHELDPDLHLYCASKEKKVDNYEQNIVDQFAFDEYDNDLDKSVRLINYKYSDELDYEKTKKNIKDGVIEIDDEKGISLIDNYKQTISIIKQVSRKDLEKEFNTTFEGKYKDINNYYRRTLKYSCSI